jgi:LmbE family N-acetylglucosaminyl deacetylase
VNVTCVFAHQDDERSCMATLLRLRRERDARITLVIVTNGELGASWDPDRPLAEVAAVREREMQAVAAALDADYVCLGRRDGFLYEDAELRTELTEVLRAARTELVFTHALEEYNDDHVVTGRATRQAALAAEIASVRTRSDALGKAPAIFHIDPGPGHGFEPTHFVSYEEEIAREKARILALHESQTAVMGELFGSDWVELTLAADRLRGARLPAPYAEGFTPCLLERRIPMPGMLP